MRQRYTLGFDFGEQKMYSGTVLARTHTFHVELDVGDCDVDDDNADHHWFHHHHAATATTAV